MKSLIACLIIAIVLPLGQPAHAAGIPTIDVANLAEAIRSNIQRGVQWGKEMAMKATQMDMESLLAKMGIQNDNNLMANNIVRRAKAMQDIQNLEVMEMSAPDDDACSTLAASNLSDQLAVVNERSLESRSREETLFQTAGRNTEDGLVTDTDLKRQTALELFEVCAALQPDGVDAAEGQELYTSLCAEPGLLMGVGTTDVYTPDQQRAADNLVRLIAGPTPTTLESVGVTDGDSPAALRKRMSDMRRLAYRKLVFNSLNAVAETRRNYSNSSSLFALQKFVDERYGDPNWLAKIGNVDGSAKNDDMPSEVQRKMAVMMAFQVHLDLLRYKQSLRVEGLQAADLALQLTPIGTEMQ